MKMYQCPFGLMLYFYIVLKFLSCGLDIEGINALSGLCSISTIDEKWEVVVHAGSINALSGLCSISTVPLQKPRFYAVSGACFCRYLSEYSDNDHFSCMLTIWTYLIATSTT